MEPKIIVALLAIAAGLFGILANHWLSQWRSNKDILGNAVLEYKEAFAIGIAAISDGVYSLDTFSADFIAHQTAVNKIRPILPERYQGKLQKAWNDYRGIGSKYEDIGFDAEEFVAAMSAMSYTTNDELFNEFKENFNNLHTCLDKLLK